MKRFKFLIFFLLLLLATNIYGQPNPDCGELDEPPCEEEEVPLDSGVGLLIGAAAFYTIKKLREKTETKKGMNIPELS